MVASYRYDPFGNTISSSGTLASANVYRFSSKEIHANSGMYYYGFRFYDPNLQRRANRDPIFEKGGYNLYRFVRNDPIDTSDPQGLEPLTIKLPNGTIVYLGDSNPNPRNSVPVKSLDLPPTPPLPTTIPVTISLTLPTNLPPVINVDNSPSLTLPDSISDLLPPPLWKPFYPIGLQCPSTGPTATNQPPFR